MNISNLKELLNAEFVNEGSVSSVLGFALSLSELKEGFAFFTDDEDEAQEALEKNAFCIVSEKRLKVLDKDAFYLRCEDLRRAVLRLLRFMSEQKQLEFVLCESVELDLAPAFEINVLQNDLHADFARILKARNHSLFAFDDERYLSLLSPQALRLKAAEYRLLPCASLFSTSLICAGHFFRNLNFCFIYAEPFANFFALSLEKKLKFNEKKLDLMKVFFVNARNEISPHSTSRAFLLVKNEAQFYFVEAGLKGIQGFKSARRDSLFADLSYNELEDLKAFRDFRYCLLLENEESFKSAFSAKESEKSLFDEGF